MYVCGYIQGWSMNMSPGICGGQRTTLRFSSFTIWVPRIELRSSSLVASISTHWASSQPLFGEFVLLLLGGGCFKAENKVWQGCAPCGKNLLWSSLGLLPEPKSMRCSSIILSSSLVLSRGQPPRQHHLPSRTTTMETMESLPLSLPWFLNPSLIFEEQFWWHCYHLSSLGWGPYVCVFFSFFKGFLL